MLIQSKFSVKIEISICYVRGVNGLSHIVRLAKVRWRGAWFECWGQDRHLSL